MKYKKLYKDNKLVKNVCESKYTGLKQVRVCVCMCV